MNALMDMCKNLPKSIQTAFQPNPQTRVDDNLALIDEEVHNREASYELETSDYHKVIEG